MALPFVLIQLDFTRRNSISITLSYHFVALDQPRPSVRRGLYAAQKFNIKVRIFPVRSDIFAYRAVLPMMLQPKYIFKFGKRGINLH